LKTNKLLYFQSNFIIWKPSCEQLYFKWCSPCSSFRKNSMIYSPFYVQYNQQQVITFWIYLVNLKLLCKLMNLKQIFRFQKDYYTLVFRSHQLCSVLVEVGWCWRMDLFCGLLEWLAFCIKTWNLNNQLLASPCMLFFQLFLFLRIQRHGNYMHR